MISFLKKHSVAVALLVIFTGVVAAPYLIPADPDSPVFRSGTFGAFVLAAAFFPVKTAIKRAGRRILIVGLIWGFLFACALSIGSELFFYECLLPGASSMLRRVAVPVLAAPLFGGVASCIMLQCPAGFLYRRRMPVWVFACVLVVCWFPVWLAYFPAMINYDFPGQYAQHLSGVYSMRHPLLYSVLANSIVAFGKRLVSGSFGLFMLAALQVGVFSLSLGYACAFAQRHGAPPLVLAMLTALFAFHPIFSVMAVSMTKDTLFAAMVLLLTLESWSMLEKPQEFFSQRGKRICFAILCTLVVLLRNNGVFAIVLLLGGLIFALRGYRERILRLTALCVVSPVAVFFMLNLALHPQTEGFELYSLPAQQLVRAYHLGEMSDSDKEELESWYTYKAGLFLTPHLADRAKGHLKEERLQTQNGAFLELWARNARGNVRVYTEAFLLLNIGSWYPDDFSHASIYWEAFFEDRGYLQTQEYDMSQEGFDTICLLPSVRELIERICRRNEYQKTPFLPILFCTATPFWVLMFSAAVLAVKRRRKMWVGLFGIKGLWLSYLFGPCTLPRYMLPFFCLAPVALIFAFSIDEGENLKDDMNCLI